MLISVQALNVIVTIARCGSFSAAAEELHKVPTALSYTVHKLEDELGAKLFERQGKQLILTEAGRYFLKKGQLILSELGELQHTTRRIASGAETSLSLTLNNIISLQPLYALLKQSEQHFPQTEIQLSIDVHDGVWDALLEKRADIAIGAPNQVVRNGEVLCAEMPAVEWVFAIAPDHPLAAVHRSLQAEDLRRYPAICIQDTSVQLEPKVAWQLRGQKALVAADYHSKIAMHRHGLGIGFLPRHFCQRYIDDGSLVSVPVDVSKPATPLFLAWQNEPPRPCCHWWLTQLQRADILQGFLTDLS
ncbi:LysR substrate-binding domain-containing protein [Klebsiella oxytoca]|uniref:LysR substrate-binding domain-containing protein n=2 Tax=Klebsiella oxytoca TaxID=571 RepID=UPI0006688E2C|nr:LysR substrate-binding domain-containing protein [Klebsiella oxytoca]EKX3847131.1 LysR family transcriptional regulator [Klebsiella oxytoca]MBZ7571626.1 LysR family transcriptional regulator [Klebsiella oxytoca]NKX96292.1 LysR family transcriptional regulator [Klebsiella oxytoca]SAQ22200.1 LysR-family transcriptional regulator YdhB [Klebsiella oxytoca]HCT8038152.1 LysR family transcriptional regulator [Klebsiella oxytoca]